MPASDGSDDFVGVCDPMEGLRLGIVILEEAVDGGLEVDNRTEDAAFEATLGQFGEEALDRIEPGGRGRGEVERPARVALKPGPHPGVLVGRVIVEDDVDRLVGGDLALNGVEKADEFEVAVALHTAADDGAVEHAERGEQGGGAVTLLVMRHGLAPAPA